MTAEHLKPTLDSARDAGLLCHAAELMARAAIPEEVLKAIRMGQMTALQKPTGGVRGIVAGDIIRRRATNQKEGGEGHSTFTICIIHSRRVRMHCACDPSNDRRESAMHSCVSGRDWCIRHNIAERQC